MAVPIGYGAGLVLPLLLAIGAPPPAGDVVAKVDALYRQRDTATGLAQMEELLRDGIAASPDDYGLLWRMARLSWWKADDAPADRKRALGKEGRGFAERAIAVDQSAPEGHYYAAICIGAYSQGVGILRALAEGLESRFNDHLDRALRDAPDFDLGGASVAKGRYWYELPWPKRSLRKSADTLSQVVERHPENLRAWLYLAETQLADGDADAAAATVARLLRGDVGYDPPEGQRIQRLARALQERLTSAK